MLEDSNWLFYYNDNKLYVIVELTETYSDDFGLSTFDFKFIEFKNYVSPVNYQTCTRMARKSEDFILTAEQAKENYPEFFI
jgi:hypothetical protein